MDRKFNFHAQVKRGVIPFISPDTMRSTGFIIGRSGLCLTAYHNVRNEILTNRDGQFIDVVAFDEKIDVALIQLPKKSYWFLELGNSDQLSLGDTIFHYGFGMNELIGFHGQFHAYHDNFLHTNAQMMHGQSGGPLVNSFGKVVGINKGHFDCTPEKLDKFPAHTGPSTYIPVNHIMEFLNLHARNTDQGWVIK